MIKFVKAAQPPAQLSAIVTFSTESAIQRSADLLESKTSVSLWHDRNHNDGAEQVRSAPVNQTSTCSAIASASSTSMPR